jgi:hypothetical protein
MKYLACVFALFFLINKQISAQNYFEEDPPEERRNSITIGILNGGGSLVGADFETLLTDRLGLQIGAGIIGFGAGINFHLQPSIRSSFISVQYWNQGIGEGFVQSAVGPNFVFRGKKWFTFQIGYGAIIERGPAYPDNLATPSGILLYSIGAYFPL